MVPENSAEALTLMARHIDTLKACDLDGVMADYAQDTVLIMPTATFVGFDQIRDMFTGFMGDKEAAATLRASWDYIGKGTVAQTFIMNGGQANELRGIEIFVIRGGKIVFQGIQSMEHGPA